MDKDTLDLDRADFLQNREEEYFESYTNERVLDNMTTDEIINYLVVRIIDDKYSIQKIKEIINNIEVQDALL